MGSIAADVFEPEVQPPLVAACPAKAASRPGARSRPSYVIKEVPIGTPRPIRVICMGAGYSGLMMAIIFDQQMQAKNAELVIYERNEDLGGTWLENRHVTEVQVDLLQ